MKDLRQFTAELSNSLPFMEGRDKGDFKSLLGQKVTIRNFGFMNDEDGDYVCFTVDEDEKRFYFGGMVLTEQMHKMDEEGYREAIESEGLPVMFNEKKSKNKKTYTSVEYYPE